MILRDAGILMKPRGREEKGSGIPPNLVRTHLCPIRGGGGPIDRPTGGLAAEATLIDGKLISGTDTEVIGDSLKFRTWTGNLFFMLFTMLSFGLTWYHMVSYYRESYLGWRWGGTGSESGHINGSLA